MTDFFAVPLLSQESGHEPPGYVGRLESDKSEVCAAYFRENVFAVLSMEHIDNPVIILLVTDFSLSESHEFKAKGSRDRQKIIKMLEFNFIIFRW